MANGDCDGRRAMGDGRWAIGDRRWAMAMAIAIAVAIEKGPFSQR
jgi:hypothetical protein